MLFLQGEVGEEQLGHGGQGGDGPGMVSGEVACGVGQGAEPVADALQDGVQRFVLAGELGQVHRVGPDPGRQGGEEQLIFVPMVQVELSAVLAVEGSDGRDPPRPVAWTHRREGARQPPRVDPERLVDQGDDEHVGPTALAGCC